MKKDTHKYYVLNGKIRMVVLAESPLQACVNVILLQREFKKLHHSFFVDERGFRGSLKCTHTIDTDDVLNTAGFEDIG